MNEKSIGRLVSILYRRGLNHTGMLKNLSLVPTGSCSSPLNSCYWNLYFQNNAVSAFLSEWMKWSRMLIR